MANGVCDACFAQLCRCSRNRILLDHKSYSGVSKVHKHNCSHLQHSSRSLHATHFEHNLRWPVGFQASHLQLRVSAESQPKRNASILHRLSCHQTRIVNELYDSSDCQRLKHCAAGASAEEFPSECSEAPARAHHIKTEGWSAIQVPKHAYIDAGTLQTSCADGGDVLGLNLQAVACPAGRPPVIVASEAR